MTISFTLKYTGSCPDPAEPSAGTLLPARALPWFPAITSSFGEWWRSREKMRISCCLPSPLLPGRRHGATDCGVFPSLGIVPELLQTWACGW